MPIEKVIGPFVPDSAFDRVQFVQNIIEKTRRYLLNRLEEAFAISDKAFKSICMFSIVDMLAQEFNDYPSGRGSRDCFCSFILRFQSKYDFLEKIDPVTLFYDYESSIKLLIKYPELNRLNPVSFGPEYEVGIDDLNLSYGSSFCNVLDSGKANEILNLVERQDGLSKRLSLSREHSVIHLLYTMRSKAVHELSSLGEEDSWVDPLDCDLPFYRDMSSTYVKENNLVTFDSYELVFPHRFLYNLAKDCIVNYLDYCCDEVRLPFYNNSDFQRSVFQSWVERKK